MIKRRQIRNRAQRNYQLKALRARSLIAYRKRAQSHLLKKDRKERMTIMSSMRKVRKKRSMKMKRSMRKNMRMSKPKKMETI